MTHHQHTGRIEAIGFDHTDLAFYRSPAKGERIGGLVLILVRASTRRASSWAHVS